MAILYPVPIFLIVMVVFLALSAALSIYENLAEIVCCLIALALVCVSALSIPISLSQSIDNKRPYPLITSIFTFVAAIKAEKIVGFLLRLSGNHTTEVRYKAFSYAIGITIILLILLLISFSENSRVSALAMTVSILATLICLAFAYAHSYGNYYDEYAKSDGTSYTVIEEVPEMEAKITYKIDMNGFKIDYDKVFSVPFSRLKCGETVRGTGKTDDENDAIEVFTDSHLGYVPRSCLSKL